MEGAPHLSLLRVDSDVAQAPEVHHGPGLTDSSKGPSDCSIGQGCIAWDLATDLEGFIIKYVSEEL